MISAARSTTIQWGKQLAQGLNAGLSLIVFTVLDFLDCVFCIVFAYLDEFFEDDAASPCQCHHSRRSSKKRSKETTDVRHDGQAVLSETLYARRNVFREAGWLRRRQRLDDEVEEKKVVGHGGDELRRWREKVNRWSDCGCESCVSWMKNNADDLRLHVVVQDPAHTSHSPVDIEDSEAKSTENVIFLHGFLSSSSFWTQTVFANLSEQKTENKYKLFAVDLLGFGRSPKPRDCLYTLEDHLEMIEKSVIVDFGLSSFHLVAHSMGCVIALALAAKHPDSVKSLTLVAPPYFPSSRSDDASSFALRKLAGKTLWPPLLFGASFMAWYEHLGRIMCLIVCRNHRIWESIIRLLTWKRDLPFMITDITKHTHHSAWHTMHNVICGGAKLMDEYLEILSLKKRLKISVIQGDEDIVVPLECSYNIRVKIPEADVRIMPKADHSTVVLEQTKEFIQILEGIWLSCN